MFLNWSKLNNTLKIIIIINLGIQIKNYSIIKVIFKIDDKYLN